MVNPRVPVVKQVNLYQKGLRSPYAALSFSQPGTGIERPPQAGTVCCVKVDVPHTGKAVPGFCPKLVQGCA